MTTDFQERVYSKLKKVPKGKVTTYKELALAIGCGSSQAVGQALKRNPYAPKVPCHRVVASDSSIGGFSGHRKGKEIKKKIAILKKEGVEIKDSKVIGFDPYKF
ncbi:MGMT family protein [Candidatus Woesearchaeota archaeon]|nr:MGMT family protein [Candidatus Woesearchaeota archaeon]